MNVLMVGDVVGAPGRHALARVVTLLRGQGKVDVVIANAENAAGGQGLNPSLAADILSSGVDAITLGDHTWDQKDLAPYLDKEPRVVRPANFAPACPGRGFTTIDTPHGQLSVVNVIGRVFLKPYDCPFRTVDSILKKELSGRKMIFVDIHAEATSEKIVMGRFLDGRVSAVVGTHTHVQTSDEAILPKGTAYITDLGMTGGKDSVLGRDLESVLSTFLTGMPARFKISEKDVVLEGVIIGVDPGTGRASSIKRIRETA